MGGRGLRVNTCILSLSTKMGTLQLQQGATHPSQHGHRPTVSKQQTLEKVSTVGLGVPCMHRLTALASLPARALSPQHLPVLGQGGAQTRRELQS